MAFIGKLLSNVANRLDPKFTITSNGITEKFNSVQAMKMRTKQLEKKGIDYTFRERW